MKRISLLMIIAMCCLSLTSCSVSKTRKVEPEPTHKVIVVSSTPSGAEVYMEGKYLGVTPLNVEVQLKYQFYTSGLMAPKARYEKSAELSATTFKFVKVGYETVEEKFKPVITQRIGGFRNYNGQIMGLDYIFPDGIHAELKPTNNNASVDTTIPVGESGVAVSRDAAGASGLEKTIIRWYFDSEPRGARVSWRVISSVPAQVKNTNESYLGTTPFEETRSFNILGLTYENSRDVQIEVKVTKNGYIEQTKRFNVRQAIDQMEISSFYDLVPRE